MKGYLFLPTLDPSQDAPPDAEAASDEDALPDSSATQDEPELEGLVNVMGGATSPQIQHSSS